MQPNSGGSESISGASDNCGAPTVAVVGGGWYGCHIAHVLRQRGFQIKLFERAPKLFQGASGNNQFRLHAGFHYPRSSLTRMQISSGLLEFNQRLPMFVRKLDKCIYAISDRASLLDFGTFTTIFESERIPFEKIHASVWGLSGIEGAVHTPAEQLIYVDTPRKFYEVALSEVVENNAEVVSLVNVKHNDTPMVEILCNGQTERFDWCINCTYNQISRVSTQCFYEVCLTLIYEEIVPRDEIVGITIMDGEFCSLYPYILSEDDYLSGRRRYTLTHVRHTPLFTSKTLSEVKAFMDGVSDELVHSRLPLFEKDFCYYYPAFKQEFRFVDWFVSMKTKPLDCGASNHTASRECLAEADGRIVNVLSGKINTLFEAERMVLGALLRSWSANHAKH